MYMYIDSCFKIVYLNCVLYYLGDIFIFLFFLWYYSCYNFNKEVWIVLLSFNDFDLFLGLRIGFFISCYNDFDIYR